jgi:hypothetical protein
MRCPLCNAPEVVIHWNDCPLANRAQRLGPAPDPTKDPLVWAINPETDEYEPVTIAA